MSLGVRRTFAIATVLLLALSSAADAESKRRTKKQQKQEEAAPAVAPVDRRDRLVNAPGTPFNGRAWWQAAAQCGGTYFKLGTLHSEAAVRAKVVRPDPAAFASLTRDMGAANRSATVFFEAAERFLIADRKVSREDAVLTYDSVAGASGDRVKTVDAAMQGARACPELYIACHGAYPQVCSERSLPN